MAYPELSSAAVVRARFNAAPRILPPDRSWKASAAFFALVFLLPTVIYAYVADRFGFLGPRLNLDLLLLYALGVLVAARWPRAAMLLVVAGVLFTLAIQIGVGLGAVYLDDPALVREYLSFVEFWPWRLIGFWSAVAAVALTLLYLLGRRIELRRVSLIPMVVVGGALLFADLASRTAAGYEIVGDNVATSSIARSYKLGRKWATNPGFVATPLPQPMMVRDVMAAPPSRVVSIAVEALGLSRDPTFNAAMLAPLQAALGDRFEVSISRHVFKGGTLSGELRELCNVRAAGTPTREQAAALGPDCLPAQLADRGYETLGMHGNSHFFYNRRNVYPALGFGKTLFYDDFVREKPAPALCKTRAFNGICDSVVVDRALRFVGAGDKRYAHIITLDTHFPLGETELGDETCRPNAGTASPDLCLYQNQFANLLAQMGRQIAAAKVAPDVVYIVGDHAPPYVVAEQRYFFDRQHVPYIVIRRR